MPRLIVQSVEPKDKRDNDVWVASSYGDWNKILPLLVAKLQELQGE